MAPPLRAAILTVGMALTAAAALPAAAQDRAQQRAWCVNATNTYSLDLQIGGCTALIQSGTLGTTDLAVAFNNRGQRLAINRSIRLQNLFGEKAVFLLRGK